MVMQYAVTSFDYACYPPRPLQSLVVGEQKKFYTFYQSGTGKKLSEISENIATFKRHILSTPTCLNDYKAHLAAFKIEQNDQEIYDLCVPRISIKSEDMIVKKSLVQVMKSVRNRKPDGWRKLFADASVVYQMLEDRGIFYGYKRMPVVYNLETFTGRSKTLVFNVQGTTDEFDLHSGTTGYFVHFDWIAADLFMAAHMSGDSEMLDSFTTSDPYTRLEQLHNHPEFGRDRCKKELLSSIYALKFNSPSLDFYPWLKKWMIQRSDFMRLNGYLTSIMGRRFYVKKNNELSVFNAQFQGSVAHAMQAALVKLSKNYAKNILAEVHDSIIMTCEEVNLRTLIADVVEIMSNPLDDWVADAPLMPIRVSIGKKWRKWKKFREFRPA